jgi:hypothetical protein
MWITLKLKYILNVFNDTVLRRRCVPEGEEVTGNWRKEINEEFQKRSAGGLHEKMRRRRHVARMISKRNIFKFYAKYLKT